MPTNPEVSSVRGVELEARLGSHTDIGRVRDNNEDSLIVYDLERRRALGGSRPETLSLNPGAVLLVVADGMGGMSGGDQASQMCIEQFPPAVSKLLRGRGANRRSAQDALSQAIQKTHESIYSRAQADERLRGMGTTLTAALLEGDQMWLAQVGDSRAYLYRAGTLQQLTRDQTVWDALREAGQDPETTLGKGPWKSTLTQALGGQAEVRPVMTELAVHAGDWLLLSSDGLYRAVSEEQIAAILRADTDVAAKARALTAAANEGGGPDNISVIVCQLASRSG